MTAARRAAVFVTLAASALTPTLARAQATPAPRPRAPYLTAACPFECCTYGRWRFVTPAIVRARPDSTGAVVARIAAEERVRADSGHVRLDTLGLAYVRRDYRDPDAGATYYAGDTLVVLDYLGEGFSNVWVRGEIRQLSLLYMSTEEQRAGGVPDTAAMVELRPPTAAWWVHVTLPVRVAKDRAPTGGTARARRGWVQMTNDIVVRGADACGGPD